MRGTIIKRDTGYFIAYELGKTWDEKNRVWKRRKKMEKIPAPNNKKHAERLLTERLSQINKGEFVEPSKITFAEFQKIWMEKYAVGEGRYAPPRWIFTPGISVTILFRPSAEWSLPK